MEKNTLPSPLPEAETFARVWQRVMPEPGSSPLMLRPAAAPPAPLTAPEDPLLPLLEGLSRSAVLCRRQARSGGPAAGFFAQMSVAQRQSLRSLTALYYLRTGQPFRPAEGGKTPPPLPVFLRQEYLLCRRLEGLTAALEQGEQDPCFRDIFRALRAQLARWSRSLCALLAQFLPPS